MNNFKLFLFPVIALVMLMSGSIAFSQNNLQGRVVVVPAGRSIDSVAINGISSGISRVGDPFTVRLENGFYDNGVRIFPGGTVIEGRVTEVTPTGRTGKNGTMGVRFTNAVLPNGKRVSVSAIIETKDGSGIVRGGTKKGRIGKMLLRGAEGAAVGALFGTAMGGITGGKVGRGAAIGTAIGGGAGVATGVVKKGNDAEIKSGKQVELMLTQPLRTTAY